MSSMPGSTKMHQPIDVDDILAWYRMIQDYYTLDHPNPSLPYAESDIEMICYAAGAQYAFRAQQHERCWSVPSWEK